MSPAIRFLMFAAWSLTWLLPPMAAAQQAEQALPTDGDLRADSGGIVTNRAITVAGHEFFNHFIVAWRDKPDSERYTLAVH